MAKNTNTNGLSKNKLNPTIGFAYEDARFGEGSLKTSKITAEQFANIQKYVQEGSVLVIKRTSKDAEYGTGKVYALEVLPPMERANTGANGNRRASRNDDAGI